MAGLEYFSVPFVVGLMCFLAVMGTAFVGFAVGFYGPIFFSPGASQGPLLGILLTGPLGAMLGLVAPLFYILKMRKTSVSQNDS